MHAKHFIAARRDPSFAQLGSCLARTTFSHIIASARLNGIKMLTKKYPYKHISIYWKYFDCVFTTYMMSIYKKKKLTNIFIEFHQFTKANTKGVLQKRCSSKFCNIHRKTLVLESLCRSLICQKLTPRLSPKGDCLYS